MDADDGAVSGLLAWTGVFLPTGVLPRVGRDPGEDSGLTFRLMEPID